MKLSELKQILSQVDTLFFQKEDAPPGWVGGGSRSPSLSTCTCRYRDGEGGST